MKGSYDHQRGPDPQVEKHRSRGLGFINPQASPSHHTHCLYTPGVLVLPSFQTHLTAQGPLTFSLPVPPQCCSDIDSCLTFSGSPQHSEFISSRSKISSCAQWVLFLSLQFGQYRRGSNHCFWKGKSLIKLSLFVVCQSTCRTELQLTNRMVQPHLWVSRLPAYNM